MGKNYIQQGIKNIVLLIIGISLFAGIFLYKYKEKVNLLNYSLDSLNIYWIISTIIYASILIMIYSYNKQYPNSNNRLLNYFKKFNKKDYFVIFSSIFSLNFLVSLFTDFHSAMNYGSIYAVITFAYLIMVIFGFIGVIFLSIKMVYRLIKKIFGHSRIKLNKDRRDIYSVLKWSIIDGSYLTYNVKSKAPKLIKIFNVIIYGIFLILLISILFTINKPQEISGKVLTLGELEEMHCRGRGGCTNTHNYLLGIDLNNGLEETFVFTKNEFNKCDWNITNSVMIETNPIIHTIPSLNTIKECR